MTDEFAERRKYKRCEVMLPAELKNDEHVAKSHTLDLCIGGTRIQSFERFPLHSKVYVSILVPNEEEKDVQQVKVIGKITRVEEVATDVGSTTYLGIKFDDISSDDLDILKVFLKDKFQKNKAASKKEALKTKSNNSIDGEDSETQSLDAEYALIKTPKMAFFERLFMREDYADIFTRIAKGSIKILLYILLFYVSYGVTKVVMRLIQLSIKMNK